MVFVTGGTGLVGSYLLLSLCKKESQVRALKLKNASISGTKQLFERENETTLFDKIQWIDGDLDDVSFLGECLKDITTIFHAAACVSFDERKKKEILNTNAKGTENLVNAAISLKVKEFIFFSSIATLGTKNSSGYLDENSEWNDELTHSTYTLSKFRAEMNVWRASQEGLDVLVICPSIIIGSLNGTISGQELFKKAFQKTVYITAGACTGFVDVRDIVKVILMLVEQKKFNEKYILSSENKAYKDILTFLREKANRKAPKLISNSMLSFLYYIFKIGALFGRESISKANYDSLTIPNPCSNEKIVKELNFSFIPVNEALEYHFEQYKKLNL